MSSMLASVFDPLLVKVPILFSPAGSILAMICILYGSFSVYVMLSYVMGTPRDNVHPRLTLNTGEWKALTVHRALSAFQNNLEGFAMFAAAVLLGMITLGHKTNLAFAQLCNLYLISRIAYTFVYVVAYNPPLSGARSAVFFVGIFALIRMLNMAIEAAGGLFFE